MTIRDYLNYSPNLGEGTYIDETAVVIGRVSLGNDSSVWPLAVIRGDVNEIKIGDRSNIQDGSVLHVTHSGATNPGGFPLSIGNDVTIGHKAILHGCTIRDRVLIGMGSIVMDGAIIEPDVIVAAGSVVSPGKTLESGYLYVGSPAKQARALKKEERDFLLYSAEHYVQQTNLYRE